MFFILVGARLGRSWERALARGLGFSGLDGVRLGASVVGGPGGQRGRAEGGDLFTAAWKVAYLAPIRSGILNFAVKHLIQTVLWLPLPHPMATQTAAPFLVRLASPRTRARS
jgi:hypothetical protein